MCSVDAFYSSYSLLLLLCKATVTVEEWSSDHDSSLRFNIIIPIDRWKLCNSKWWRNREKNSNSNIMGIKKIQVLNMYNKRSLMGISREFSTSCAHVPLAPYQVETGDKTRWNVWRWKAMRCLVCVWQMRFVNKENTYFHAYLFVDTRIRPGNREF